MKSSILKLKLYSVLIGLSVGMLELYIGHRFILDKLLIGRDYNFVYESFFAPTYYGLTKSFIVAVVFFLVSLFAPKNKTNPIIVGILGAAIFGLYYYFTFPRSSFYSSALIGIVHFSFIAGTIYIFNKIFKFKTYD